MRRIAFLIDYEEGCCWNPDNTAPLYVYMKKENEYINGKDTQFVNKSDPVNGKGPSR